MAIRVLPPEIAEKIAAGEVIERPASVIKELVENSIDAGATLVHVQLEDGGRELIEVTDNGKGMSPEDLELSVLRHATSKISRFEDLERLTTLGFRGEALASIQAVSGLQIISRHSGQVQPYELLGAKRAQPVTFGHFLGSEHGTCIRARGLFSEMPARLKFLKAPSAEASAVRDHLERLAFTHPEIGFSLSSADRSLLKLRPETPESRIRALLDVDPQVPIRTHTLDDPASGFQVAIHWAQGVSLSHTRQIFQSINRRWIRDRAIQSALLSPFKQSLLPGQFPAIAIEITIDPAQIDVNVSPTKSEVRFLDSRRVLGSIRNLVDELVSQHGHARWAGQLGSQSQIAGEAMPSFTNPAIFSDPALRQEHFQPPLWSVSEEIAARQGTPTAAWTHPQSLSGLTSHESQSHPATERPNTLPAQNYFLHLAQAAWVGTCFKTYLLFEDTELVAIDQHAAHERIRYERLKKHYLEFGTIDSQQLLTPEVIRIDEAIQNQEIETLSGIGLEVEAFGENEVMIRSVPAIWNGRAIAVRAKNLIHRLRSKEQETRPTDSTASKESLLLDERLFEEIASESCRGSVMSGDLLSELQARTLIQDLSQCENPWNCPHGRPTVVRIPESRFEQWFERRVPH
jgi:DNA mismatch repair protein MutL